MRYLIRCGTVVAAALGLVVIWRLVCLGVTLRPFGWLRWKRSVRLHKFEEQFPEALDVLSRAVRAGHAFQSALGMSETGIMGRHGSSSS